MAADDFGAYGSKAFIVNIMNIDADVVYGVNVIIVNWNSATSTAATTLDIQADLFDDDLEAVAAALHDAKLSENVGTGRRADQPSGC